VLAESTAPNVNPLACRLNAEYCGGVGGRAEKDVPSTRGQDIMDQERRMRRMLTANRHHVHRLFPPVTVYHLDTGLSCGILGRSGRDWAVLPPKPEIDLGRLAADPEILLCTQSESS
jgi:hypothetical protein